LLLKCASPQCCLRGVASIHLHTQIELFGELPSKRDSTGENRAPRLDADRAGQRVTGERRPPLIRSEFFGDSVFCRIVLR
jgi:hypothetical protein